MTDERTITAILSVSISAGIAIGSALIQLDKKVDALAGEIKFMSGVLSTLPNKLDELTKEMRSR